MPTSASTCCNPAVRTADLSLARHGAQLLPGLAGRVPVERAGARIVGDPGATGILASPSPVCAAVERLGGRIFRPVRAILFDKSDAVNWALGWHQDRTISVGGRAETEGFGPWT